jgi:hypothetical protein
LVDDRQRKIAADAAAELTDFWKINDSLSTSGMPDIKGFDQFRCDIIFSRLSKKWQAEGKLKGDFESIIKIQYDKLDDANTTLFLFLQAVRCESQYGNQDLAKEILIFAREEFRRRQNVKTDIAPSSSQLAPAELNEINKSDLSSEILKVFGDIGTSIESHQRIAGDEDN